MRNFWRIHDNIFLWAVVIVWFALLCLAGYTVAHADTITGQERRDWIKGLQNQDHNLCCSEADGQSLQADDWDIRGNEYWVRLPQDGTWHKVEAWMVVSGPNRAGPALVWTYGEVPAGTEDDGTNSLKFNVRCFMPGALF